MSWVKIDDQFPDHPKVIAAGPAAGWLYVCGLCYCGRYLTDGFIPSGQVRRLADLKDPQRLADSLVSVGLWETVEGGYQVHDYLVYNPSRAQVLANRESRSQAGRRGGVAKALANAKQMPDHLPGSCQPVATDNALANSYPVPSPTPNTYTQPPAPPPLARQVTDAIRSAGIDAGDFEMRAYWPVISQLQDMTIVRSAITKTVAKKAGIAYLFAIVSNELARASPPPPRERFTIVSVGKGFHEMDDTPKAAEQ